MIALAVHDLVDDTDLAAGRTIAGTGTLSLDGAVGRIDSVGLKVLAAVDEGADVFLAPADQADVARTVVPDDVDLQIVGVDTFAEAREQLRAAAPLVEEADATSSVQPADDRCRFERAA
jgi:PDZ domain-containing protein